MIVYTIEFKKSKFTNILFGDESDQFEAGRLFNSG